MFKKLKFRIIKNLDIKYSINHLLTFFKKNKKLKNKIQSDFLVIEKTTNILKRFKNKLSTSLIYILSSDKKILILEVVPLELMAFAARKLKFHVDVTDISSNSLKRMKKQIFPKRYGKWDNKINLFMRTYF